MTTLTDRIIAYPSEAAWLAGRRNGLGASEIAAVLGLSHFKDATPFRVWSEKCDPDSIVRDAEQEKNLSRGSRAEKAILGEFADEHRDLYVEPWKWKRVVHPAYPLIGCSPDGTLYERLSGLMEDPNPDDVVTRRSEPSAGGDAKFMDRGSRKDFGEPGTDEMPDAYVTQALISCECLEVPRWYFPCWFGRWEYAEFVVERNTAVAEALIVRALEWWHAHVATEVPPALDGSEGAEAFVKRIWPENRRALLLPASAQHTALAAASTAAREAIAAAEERKREADTQLRAAIGDADGIAGIATWKQNRPSSKTDWEAVARAAGASGEIIAAHTTTHPGPRVLRLTWRPEA